MDKFCTIYLVRHGQSTSNLKGVIAGQSDVRLTDKGLEQAQQLREDLKGVSFDAIYSSDLRRAKKTAEILASGKKIVAYKSLREKSQKESDEELMKRFMVQLVKMAKNHADKTILVVIHAHIIRVLLNQLGYVIKNKLPPDFSIGNAAQVVIRSNGEKMGIEKVVGVN